MTALLVLATVIVFLVIDFFYGRKPALQVAEQPARRPSRALEARPVPAMVSGFRLPENLRYHPGHTWALSESPNLVRVGFDDFAARLVGHIDSITLPQRGQWVRQGQKLCTLKRNGATVDMLSPIEGTVTEINEALLQSPAAAPGDPYGEGWLVTVHSPDAKINFRNLLGGALARWWMEEAATRLQRQMPTAYGAAYAQDGGLAVESITAEMNDTQWQAMAREFFLS
jgi:glycine cleavage system H protein